MLLQRSKGSSSLSKFIERNRLIDLLGESQARAITWIAAGAGFGKTTLLASYLAQIEAPVLHLRIPKEGLEPGSFFHKLRDMAINLVGPSATALPTMSPEFAGSWRAFVAVFLNKLDQLLPHCHLVIDDYHYITKETQIDQALSEYLAEQGQTTLRLIIASRLGFSAHWAKLDAAREIFLLDEEDLLFDSSEVQSLFELYPTLDASLARATMGELLGEGMRGWVAGIVLIAERLQRKRTVDLKVSSAKSRESIFQYLLNQFLDLQTPEVRTTLLELSLLPVVPIKNIHAFCEGQSVPEVLEQAVNHRLAIKTGKPDDPGFLFHDLISEFLRNVAKSELTEGKQKELRKMGAAMFAQRGDLEEAIFLYTEAEDWCALGALINSNASALMRQGRQELLQVGLGVLPEEILQREPCLAYWLSLCLMARDGSRAKALLIGAYEQFKAKEDVVGMSEAWAAIIDTIWMGWENFHEFDHWIEEFFEHLAVLAPTLPPEIAKKNARGIFAALSLRCPDHPAFGHWDGVLNGLLLTPMEASDRVLISIQLLYHYVFIEGDRAKSSAVVTALRTAGHDDPSQLTPMAKIFLYDCLSSHAVHFGNGPEEVYDLVDRGLQTAKESGVHIWDAGMLTAALNNALAWEDLDKARYYLKRFSAVQSKDQPGYAFLTQVYASYMAWLNDDIEEALYHAERTLATAEKNGGYNVILCALIPMIVLLGEAERFDEALKFGRRARKMARSGNSKVKSIVINLALAQICLKKGYQKRALAYLKPVREIGERERYLSLPWLRPSRFSDLLALANQAFGETVYFNELISRFDIAPPRNVDLRMSWSWRCKIRCLGRWDVNVDGKSLFKQSRAPQQLSNVLQYLVLLGPKGCSQDQLCLAIWPDAEANKVQGNYKTTIHRLRRLLGSDKAVLSSSGQVGLNPDYCWIDSWALTDLLERGRKVPDAQMVQSANALYRGKLAISFNAGDAYLSLEHEIWDLYSDVLERYAFSLELLDAHNEAIEHYKRLLSFEASHETAYQGLMRCYSALGKREASIRAYQACRQALADDLGVAPSPETEELYRQIANPLPQREAITAMPSPIVHH